MNEDLHIEKAAHLADKPGAENLATGRAKKYVADTLADRKQKEASESRMSLRPVYAWGGVAVALAACVAVAVILFRPATDGVPGTLIEQQNIHADTDAADTTTVGTSDTLFIERIILPE